MEKQFILMLKLFILITLQPLYLEVKYVLANEVS